MILIFNIFNVEFSEFEALEKRNTNKNIEPQKRFRITRKPSGRPKNALSLPTAEEHTAIETSLQLLRMKNTVL